MDAERQFKFWRESSDWFGIDPSIRDPGLDTDVRMTLAQDVRVQIAFDKLDLPPELNGVPVEKIKARLTIYDKWFRHLK